MDFLEKLDYLMKEKKLNKSKLSVLADVPYTTIVGLYTKGYENTKLTTIRKIASALGVTLDYLVGDDETKKAPSLSLEAEKVARQYDDLDAWGKKVVQDVIEDEAARMASESTQEAVDEPRFKIIPLLRTSAAAGAGEPDTGLPWEDYEVPADSRAEFAVKISGDSMEPVLPDGSIQLCLKRKPEVGDLVVMMVNGFMVCKQFITDGYNIYLRSLNRDRKDCDIDIWSTGDDTTVLFGIVMLPKRLPLVRQ